MPPPVTPLEDLKALVKRQGQVIEELNTSWADLAGQMDAIAKRLTALESKLDAPRDTAPRQDPAAIPAMHERLEDTRTRLAQVEKIVGGMDISRAVQAAQRARAAGREAGTLTAEEILEHISARAAEDRPVSMAEVCDSFAKRADRATIKDLVTALYNAGHITRYNANANAFRPDGIRRRRRDVYVPVDR